MGKKFLWIVDFGLILFMFLLLCKFFLIKKEFRGYGFLFFILFVFCILEVLDEMKVRNVIYYVLLVLLMVWEGLFLIDLLEDLKGFEKKDFKKIKCEFFRVCEISKMIENFIFVNVLLEMEGIYIVKNDK